LRKRIFLPVVAIFLAIALVLPAAQALITHGYTSSWDRGGKTDNPPDAESSYDTSTGQLSADSTKDAYAEAYLNSAQVDAAYNVNSITVTVWYTNGNWWVAGGYANMDVKLYVNGVYKGVHTETWISGSGYVQFTCIGYVQAGSDLDVDIVFRADSESPYGGTAHISATITYVAFTTN